MEKLLFILTFEAGNDDDNEFAICLLIQDKQGEKLADLSKESYHYSITYYKQLHLPFVNYHRPSYI